MVCKLFWNAFRRSRPNMLQLKLSVECIRLHSVWLCVRMCVRFAKLNILTFLDFVSKKLGLWEKGHAVLSLFSQFLVTCHTVLSAVKTWRTSPWLLWAHSHFQCFRVWAELRTWTCYKNYELAIKVTRNNISIPFFFNSSFRQQSSTLLVAAILPGAHQVKKFLFYLKSLKKDF